MEDYGFGYSLLKALYWFSGIFAIIEPAHFKENTLESSKSVREVLSSGVSLAFRNGGIRFYLNDCDTAFISNNLGQITK
jgi:hypothetical protein